MLTIDESLNAILALAFREAKSRDHEFLLPEHILFASLSFPEGSELIRTCGGEPQVLQHDIDTFFQSAYLSRKPGVDPIQSQGCSALLEAAMLHVHSAGKEVLRFEDVLAAIFLLKESHARYFLKRQGINRVRVLEIISHGNSSSDGQFADDEEIDGEEKAVSDNYLSQFTTNLTKAAQAGLLDPVIGRDTLIERTIQVLCRRQKNNPLHIGEPGVGKTALTEGLAIKIASGKVPVALKGVQIIQVDLSALVAGTKYRGDFEQRMKRLVKEISAQSSAILFIDEIHNLIGTGAVNGGAMDAANFLKPLLGARKIRCIGATTYEEYRRYFEKDRALSRRFQKIDVTEPSMADTIIILQGLKDRFEQHHGVCYSPEALQAAVELSAKYIQDRFLPDKAIDVMDEAGARVQIGREGAVSIIGREIIESVVSDMTGTPRHTFQSSELDALVGLEERLKGVVFGQDQAIHAVAQAIKRSRAGFSDEERPVASFLFVGPSGVGKTELTRQLAKILGVKLLRFDMSEYQEKHSVARLIGAPPGYIGFEQGGLLTEAVRKAPHAVLLLDEIEKAHSDIYNTLLQIMDNAVLTDNTGRASDFRHVIVVMTSNVGSREMARATIGFKDAPPASSVHKALEKTFSPEFRNRLDRIVVFNALRPDQVRRIVINQLELLQKSINTKNIELDFNFQLVDWLADVGYSQQFGAREVRRLIDDRIKPFLTDEILGGRLQKGGRVGIAIKKGQPSFTIGPNKK